MDPLIVKVFIFII